MTFRTTTFDSITVNVEGSNSVQFAYTDSGVPVTGNGRAYTTIIAIHGMCFSAPIFKRVQSAASNRGVRLVALNRRNYPGSTPFTEDENKVILSGTEEQKYRWLKNRGHEIGLFIDKFIEKARIPSIAATTGGKVTGGIVLLAWSAGSGLLNAMVAHADTLPRSVRSRLSSYVRSLIFQEPHGTQFGFAVPEYEYNPLLLVDRISSVEHRNAMFGQWVSCYFEHEDISTRDRQKLSWIVPSTRRVSTIYNISKEDQEEIVYFGNEAALEPVVMRDFGKQLNEVYRRTWFPRDRTVFGDLKISFFVGGMGPAFAFDAFWKAEKDVEEAKGKGRKVNLRVVPGTNHFTHWDDPEMALDVYLECA